MLNSAKRLLAAFVVFAILSTMYTGISFAEESDWKTTYEQEFSYRANQILDYFTRTRSGTGITWPMTKYTDTQKTLWPLAMMHLKAGTNQVGVEHSLHWIQAGNYRRFQNTGGGTYQYPPVDPSTFTPQWSKSVDFHDEFFHFAGLGLVRLLMQYPQVFETKIFEHNLMPSDGTITLRQHILQSSVTDMVYETGGWLSYKYGMRGTENHLTMMHTTRYILAQEAFKEGFRQAGAEVLKEKKWLTEYAQKLYKNGEGEYDSSNYLNFNVYAFMNIYDFADDKDMKDISKAVLDWFAATYALKYTGGYYGGANSRDAGRERSSESNADALGYLWFGNAPFSTAKEENLIQTAYAILSSYRPHEAIVNIARKNVDKPFMSYNTKPDYWANIPDVSKETFYATKKYTLGTIYDPMYGWSGADASEVMWRLTVNGINENESSKVLYGQGNHFFKRGRNPFDQIAHYKNVLIQMTCVPENWVDLQNEAKHIILDTWKNREAQARASMAHPLEKDCYYTGNALTGELVSFNGGSTGLTAFPESRLFFPEAATPIDGILFYDFGNGTYIAAQPIAGTLRSEDNNKRWYDVAAYGQVAGFVIEVGISEEYGTYEGFISKIKSVGKLDKNKISEKTISYTSAAGDKLDVSFNTYGWVTQPEYDWGTVPQLPSGEGYGRIPKFFVNGRQLKLDVNDDVLDTGSRHERKYKHIFNWAVYDSPYLTIEHNMMSVNDGNTGFRVVILPNGKVYYLPFRVNNKDDRWNDCRYYMK